MKNYVCFLALPDVLDAGLDEAAEPESLFDAVRGGAVDIQGSGSRSVNIPLISCLQWV